RPGERERQVLRRLQAKRAQSESDARAGRRAVAEERGVDELMSLTVDDLIAIEEIKRLKYKYVRCLDQKRWDEIAECFVPDAVASYGGGAWAFDGRDAILEFLRSSMGSQQFLSAHRVGQPEIEVTGPDTAKAIWGLSDTVAQLEFGVDIRGGA